MGQRLSVLLTVSALAFGSVAWAQANKTTSEVEKYPDGATKVQDLTTTSPDGTVKISTVRTEYDESGRPLHETETTYSNGGVHRTDDKTWVYDDKGRLLYFESTDDVVGQPGILHKYRLRKKYDGDADTTGTTTSEQVYTSVTGKWRDFDGDNGDTAPSMTPLQPPKPKDEKKEEKKPSSGDDPGLPLPPPPKVKIGGGINWMHAPEEVTTSLFGFDANAAYRVAPQIWIVADFTRVSGSDLRAVGDGFFDQSVTRLVYMGGVQIALPAHGEVTPFVRGLIGQAHDSNTILMTSSVGTALATSIGGGVDIGLKRNLSVNIGVDLISTHFGMESQQNLRLSGGFSYGFGERDRQRPPSGGNVSLENPFAGQLANADAVLKAAKAQADKAEAEMNKADTAWMKQNLTERGQKAVTTEKEEEKKAKSAFDKSCDDLDRAQDEDNKARTPESDDKLTHARDAVKEAETALDAAERAKRQQIRQGMLGEARAKYKKIADAYDKAQDDYKAAKNAYDTWNKANGIR